MKRYLSVFVLIFTICQSSAFAVCSEAKILKFENDINNKYCNQAADNLGPKTAAAHHAHDVSITKTEQVYNAKLSAISAQENAKVASINTQIAATLTAKAQKVIQCALLNMSACAAIPILVAKIATLEGKIPVVHAQADGFRATAADKKQLGIDKADDKLNINLEKLDAKFTTIVDKAEMSLEKLTVQCLVTDFVESCASYDLAQ